MNNKMKHSISKSEIALSAILTFLTGVFVVLKLSDAIAWPWGWVLAPLWIIPAAVLGVAFLLSAIVFVASLWKATRYEHVQKEFIKEFGKTPEQMGVRKEFAEFYLKRNRKKK